MVLTTVCNFILHTCTLSPCAQTHTVHTCMHTYTYTHTHAHTRTHTHTCTHTHTHTVHKHTQFTHSQFIYIRTYAHARTHTHTYVHTHTVHTHKIHKQHTQITHMYTRTHAFMHLRMHMHTQCSHTVNADIDTLRVRVRSIFPKITVYSLLKQPGCDLYHPKFYSRVVDQYFENKQAKCKNF